MAMPNRSYAMHAPNSKGVVNAVSGAARAVSTLTRVLGGTPVNQPTEVLWNASNTPLPGQRSASMAAGRRNSHAGERDGDDVGQL